MEAVSEKMQNHTYKDIDQPDLDKAEYWEFRFHFQKSILLSLLASGKLTQQQYDSCVEKLTYKYIKPLPSMMLVNRQDGEVKYK